MVQFLTGKTYSSRSICDHNCVWNIRVIKRTKKFLTFDFQGEQKRAGIYIYNGVEHCKFSGSYSMAPSIAADRLA